MSRLLWLLQCLSALLFLLSGFVKLTGPADFIQTIAPLPELFIRGIGALELLGAIGLIVPALTRIYPLLTPLAAAGLVVIMAGATVIALVFTPDPATALLPLILGLLNAAIVYGRTRRAPIAPRQPSAAFGLATR